MSPDVQLVLQFVVGLTFLSSAVSKSLAPALFLDGLRDYRILPGWSVNHAGVIVIATEGLIASSYMSGWLLRPAGLLALGLLGVFLLVTTFALTRGLHVKCLCFGASDAEPLSVRTIVRISLLAAVLLALLTQASERDGWLGDTYSARKLLLALACAVSIQIMTSWTLAIPELARLVKGCRSCGQQTSEK